MSRGQESAKPHTEAGPPNPNIKDMAEARALAQLTPALEGGRARVGMGGLGQAWAEGSAPGCGRVDGVCRKGFVY